MLPRIFVSVAALSLAAIGLPQTPPATAPVPPPAVQTSQKPTLKPEDYNQWETLLAPMISDDGHWLCYGISPVEGDGRLVLHNSDNPNSATIPCASSPDFSDDSKWCAYLLSPPKAETDKLKEQHRPIETKLGIRNLGNGQEVVLERVASFKFLKGSHYLVAQRYHGPKEKGGGDMTVVDLSDGSAFAIGNVVNCIPNHEGNLLALEIESDSGDNGVQILDPATHVLNTVMWGKDDVANLSWADKNDTLAFLFGPSDEEHEGPAYRVAVATELRSTKPKLQIFDPSAQSDFPKGKRISDTGPTLINDDGTAVAFGIQDWRVKKKPTGKPEDKANVEVWNTHDLRVMPNQRVTAPGDARRTALCVWHFGENTWRQINDGEIEGVQLCPDFHHAVLHDPKPYASAVTDGSDYDDVWLVDNRSGERTRLLTKTLTGNVVPSRTGRYLAIYDRRNWWLYDIKTGSKRSLTDDARVPFEATEDDHAVIEKPAAGAPIWLKNDDGVLIPDEYDVWLARTGIPSITKLTDGRRDHVVYRPLDIDPSDEDDGMSMQKPFYFSTLDRDTKASGFYTCDAFGKGKQLLNMEARTGGLVKSRNTDRVLFVMMTYEQSPNVYLTNTAFSAIKPESKTNPQQAKFAWGKVELVSYKSRFGAPLQGILTYPANYDPSKTYPMVTYIYERLSDGLYQYQRPIDFNPYSVQILSQNGYFVYQPDITYRKREPGKSAVDCLEPAVQAVLDKHVGVDPKRVGLIGHSWGAYQTAFVTTVSKMFAVGVAGAPLTELTSMYNSFYWNSGVSDQVLIERGQGRMEVPFWEDPKAYMENSPVWQSAKRTAPILIAAGDADGAVDWHQAQYLYQTLRRMGKNAVLLVYAGENHNFTRRPDQLDYAHRLRHFLDVYLKGAKPEPWVTEGVPYLKKDD